MSEFTPEQHEMLTTERFLQHVLKTRKEDTPPPEKENAFLTFLQSATGAALITVVIGTIGGAWITDRIQSHTRQREAQAAAFNSFIQSQRTYLNDAFLLTGKAISAAEDLGKITSQGFYIGDGDGFTPSQRERMKQQRTRIIDNYNQVDNEWGQKRVSIGLLLRLYHGDEDKVANAWTETAAAVSDYMKCEREFSFKYLGPAGPASDKQIAAACLNERARFDRSADPLFAALTQAEEDNLQQHTASHHFWLP